MLRDQIAVIVKSDSIEGDMADRTIWDKAQKELKCKCTYRIDSAPLSFEAVTNELLSGAAGFAALKVFCCPVPVPIPNQTVPAEDALDEFVSRIRNELTCNSIGLGVRMTIVVHGDLFKNFKNLEDGKPNVKVLRLNEVIRDRHYQTHVIGTVIENLLSAGKDFCDQVHGFAAFAHQRSSP